MEAIEHYAEECKCAEIEYVRRTFSNGVRHHGSQCLACGKFRTLGIKKIPAGKHIGEYDPTIAERYNERRKRFYERRAIQAANERAARNFEWWCEYEDYLNSDEWKDKRRRVLERDRHTCQACLRRPADEVHHLTYRHVFNEPLFDLMSICRLCHRKLTELDRARNG